MMMTGLPAAALQNFPAVGEVVSERLVVERRHHLAVVAVQDGMIY